MGQHELLRSSVAIQFLLTRLLTIALNLRFPP
jgi:hypothetical protein